MPEKITKWNEDYQLIETSCREKYHCNPCTYPNCQRCARLNKVTLKMFGKN